MLAVNDLPHPEPAKPLVSVVMTTYNGARYLAEQIESILAQSLSDFELIIADDGSSDETVSILEHFAARDTRINFYVNPSNLGVNRNVSRALERTRGAFIAIADQDDIWEPEKLEILLDRIGECSAVYSDSLIIDDFGRPAGMTLLQRIGMAPAKGKEALLLLRRNCVSGHALLFRRELLDIMLPFDDALLFDQQIGITATLNAGLSYVDKPLVRHRLHGQNQTNGHLLDKPLDKREKAERYTKRRAAFVRTLRFFPAHIERNRSHYANEKHIFSLLKTTGLMIDRLQHFEHMWFDFRLFLLMLSIRNEFFYANESNKFKRCLSFAKGARYYR